MKNNWLDITLTLKNGMARWPGDPQVRIKRVQSVERGDSSNVSRLTLSSHSGTHMDAPLHFIKKAKSLDKMPLDAMIGPARVLGIKDKQRVSITELKNYRIRRGERIIFKTGNSYSLRKNSFYKDFIYIPFETAEYLVRLGVVCAGIDYLSVGGYKKDGAMVHKLLLGAGVWIIEGLDLSEVKPGDYDLICLPLKILDSDGAPARAILRRRR